MESNSFFDQLDTNKDGFVTPKEFEKGFRAFFKSRNYNPTLDDIDYLEDAI